MKHLLKGGFLYLAACCLVPALLAADPVQYTDKKCRADYPAGPAGCLSQTGSTCTKDNDTCSSDVGCPEQQHCWNVGQCDWECIIYSPPPGCVPLHIKGSCGGEV